MSNFETATYGTEKDEDGDEALFMNAFIRNDSVELDWVHEEDNAETYVQRGRAKLEKIANANTSFPPKAAFSPCGYTGGATSWFPLSLAPMIIGKKPCGSQPKPH